MRGQMQDAGGGQLQQSLLVGFGTQEELSLGEQALDGLGLLAGAGQWSEVPGSLRRALAQRGHGALGGVAAHSLR